jgi:FkbM family methyltransferase
VKRKQGALGPIEVETRYGTLSLPDVEADIVVRHLSRYGEWGWDEVRFVASTLPSEGARVLDVGAFVGTFGLGLALQRKLGAVCFVEANSAVVPLLAANVERNCTAPATVVEALVDRPGAEPRAGRCADGNLGATSFARDASAPDGVAQVAAPDRVVTLAALRGDFGEFDLLKLDVEGMELELLASDEAHLASGRAALWIECNEHPRSLAVAELLLRWGLPLYYFAFPAYNRDNLRGDPAPIFPVAYEAGLLAAPHTPPVLDERLASHRCVLRSVHCTEDLRAALWQTPRWGRPEWEGVDAQEVAALAGHSLRGETYDDYLRPGWAPGQLLGDRLKLEQARAAAARSEAHDLRTQLQIQCERAEIAEQMLARASAEALARLSELGAERERIEEANEKVAVLVERVAAAECRANAIEHSTIWRVTTPLRRALGTRSRVRAILRRGAMGIISLRRLGRRG